jgi:[acyl-carrier-protein] S-malonyltransferase
MQKTALIFAGQGAQVPGMGREWSERHALARELFARADAVLGYDLSGVCFNGPDAELTKTDNAQPGIYLVSWVALQLLQQQAPSLSFQATAGLSLGEFTALAAAGVLSFEDGLKVVRLRGRYMREACEATPGTMAALIGLEAEAAREICAEAGVELANLNCPGQIVISGEAGGIARACELAKSRGAKRALPLPVAGAYHSRLMDSARPKLRAALAEVPLNLPSVPVISNVTARPHATAGEILGRLVEQVTSPVRWEESMRYLIAQGFTRFIELGPGTALSAFMKRIDKGVRILNVADQASLEGTARAIATS